MNTHALHVALLGLVVLAGCSGSTSSDPSSSSSGGSSSGTTDTTSSSSGNASSSGSTSSSGNASSSGDAGGTPGATALTGKLGALGDVKPTVSSLWFTFSGETIMYLSSAPLTCDQLKAGSRWLGSATAGSQVVEVIVKGTPKLQAYPVPPSEVNYAQGGKSSSYEVNATSGKITYTRSDAQVLEGTVQATYADGSVSGSFHAEFCAGGQEW